MTVSVRWLPTGSLSQAWGSSFSLVLSDLASVIVHHYGSAQ